jgi:pimeloyl-ACP methyl ester carboxylesterase
MPGNESFTHVEDLIALLDHQQIETTWLVGSSAGGKLALEAAIEVPHRIDGIVLISPSVSGAPSPKTDDLDPEMIEIDQLITREDELGHIDEVNRLEVRLWLDGPREMEGRVSGAPRDMALEMNATALANYVAESSGHVPDSWARLAELKMPTTVACGSLDARHIIRRSQALSTRIPRAKFVGLEGMAHLPYLEDPWVIAALIGGALEDGAAVVR